MPRKIGWLQGAKIAFRLVILVLVTWGIWRTVEKARAGFHGRQEELRVQTQSLEAELARMEADPASSPVERSEVLERLGRLRSQRFSLRQIDPFWLSICGVLYLLGSVPSWLFWHRTICSMGQRPRLRETLRAFYIGHLGKYVPGKALVVVLRSSFVRSSRVDATVAATSVFVETPTTMAVGAFVAAAILAARHRDDVRLLILAVGLMACAGLPTLPPVFRRLVRIFQVRRANPEIERAIDGLNYRLIVGGWIAIAAGWWLLGLSLWAALRALPMPLEALSSDPSVIAQLTACAALAVVAGFLSLLPGGVGVREFVVMAMLAGDFGEAAAVISAILLRVVWLLSEAAISGILYILIRPPDPPSAESSSG